MTINPGLLDDITKQTWTKNWSGNWGLLFGSLYGDIYTIGLQNLVGKFFPHNLITFENGVSANYLVTQELNDYCTHLVDQIKLDESTTHKWSEQVMHTTDLIMDFMKELDEKETFIKADYCQLQDLRQQITVANFSIKKVIDYLPDNLKDKNLELFSKVRVYTEPVYNETDRLLKKIAKFFLGDKLSDKAISVIVKEEMDNFFEKSVIPNNNNLENRYAGCALLFDAQGKCQIFQGEEYGEIMQAITKQSLNREIKGMVAYKGKARGRVRIVLDPNHAPNFEEGDILVAGMTRPEYLSLMKKSVAFVTDAGGLLSHAAIVARELKKPCIVGTEVATKVLKDGDMVEVDAELGIIKILDKIKI